MLSEVTKESRHAEVELGEDERKKKRLYREQEEEKEGESE